jgi:hypothetical protein
MLQQKVCDLYKRDKKQVRLRASDRAQRRLCAEGGSSLGVSALRDHGGREAHASVRRDLPFPAMPYGRRDLLQRERGSAHGGALDHTLKACRVCAWRSLVASTSWACWNQRIAPSNVPVVNPTAWRRACTSRIRSRRVGCGRWHHAATGRGIDTVVDVDEVVDLTADVVPDLCQVSTPHRPQSLNTPRRDIDRGAVAVQRRPLGDLHEAAIGGQADGVRQEVHIDIQIGGASQAKRLVFGENQTLNLSLFVAAQNRAK